MPAAPRMIQSVPYSPRRRASAWQVKVVPARQNDRALRSPSTRTIRRRRWWRACSARDLHASLAASGDGVAFAYAWEHCSMLVELCACMYCYVLDFPPVRMGRVEM